MAAATRFTEPSSVETWDACFRWRVADTLRDVTIEDTWLRVAQAVGGGPVSPWVGAYVEAFSNWRLLPDERLLRYAGTGDKPTENQAPCAMLNLGAFVHTAIGTARFDRDGFVATAALAVRLLDDAILATGLVPGDMGLRIGLIGAGDALRKLGLPYASPAARDEMIQVARALAEGCLRGAIALAQERGPTAMGAAGSGLLARWQHQGLPQELIEAGARHGVRHVRLTAIERHPLLARLANDASDALDALPVSTRTAREDMAELSEVTNAIREAIQPWIDEPMDGTAGKLAALVRASRPVSGSAAQ